MKILHSISKAKDILIYLLLLMPGHYAWSQNQTTFMLTSNGTGIQLIPSDNTLHPVELTGFGGMDQGGDDHPGGGGGTIMPMYIIILGNTPSSSKNKEALPPGSQPNSQSRSSRGSAQRREGETGAQGSRTGASASGSPDENKDQTADSLLSDGQSLIAQIEVLMDTLNGPLTLIMDLDDTLLPSDNALRAEQVRLRREFKNFIEKQQALGKLRLIIVTRAPIISTHWDYFAQNDLPDPDFLISCSVEWQRPLSVLSRRGVSFAANMLPTPFLISGAQHVERGIFVDSYYDFILPLSQLHHLKELISSAHPLIASVDDTVVDNLGLILNLSHGAHSDIENIKGQLRRKLFAIYGVFAEIEKTVGDKIIVRFPTSKGALLRVLAQALSLPGATIMTGGDRIDDWDMISPPANQGYQVHTGIVVANAGKGLLRSVRDSPSDHIYISTMPYLLGVLQGVLKGLQKLSTEQPSSY